MLKTVLKYLNFFWNFIEKCIKVLKKDKKIQVKKVWQEEYFLSSYVSCTATKEVVFLLFQNCQIYGHNPAIIWLLK